MNWLSETSLWRVRKDFGFETGALQWVWPAYKMQWGRGEEGGTSWSVQRERERETQTKRERGERERKRKREWEREWVSQLLSVFSAEEPESSLAASPETQTRYVSNRLLQVGEVIPVTRLGASQTHTASLIWSVCLTCLNIQSALLGCKASPSNWDGCGCRWRC